MFKLIREIDRLGDHAGKHDFLTFDVDWAHDEVILDTLNLIKKYQASATWFVTHKTEIINEIKLHQIHEIGIHPNFNDNLLLASNKTLNSVNKVFDDLIDVVPNVLSFRSHSLTSSSIITKCACEKGIKFESNDFIPWYSGKKNSAYKVDNITKLQHFFADDEYIINNRKVDATFLASAADLRIYDFHPIHVFLNSENVLRYEKTREYHQKPNQLKDHRYQGYGIRSFLIDLLKCVNKT